MRITLRNNLQKIIKNKYHITEEQYAHVMKSPELLDELEKICMQREIFNSILVMSKIFVGFAIYFINTVDYGLEVVKLCENNCLTLEEGFNKSREIIKIKFDIDVIDNLTLPSTSLNIFKHKYYDYWNEPIFKNNYEIDEVLTSMLFLAQHGSCEQGSGGKEYFAGTVLTLHYLLQYLP